LVEELNSWSFEQILFSECNLQLESYILNTERISRKVLDVRMSNLWVRNLNCGGCEQELFEEVSYVRNRMEVLDRRSCERITVCESHLLPLLLFFVLYSVSGWTVWAASYIKRCRKLWRRRSVTKVGQMLKDFG
jgi:hypothetical protein